MVHNTKIMKIEIVQLIKDGVAQTPNVFKSYSKALFCFRDMWEKEIGEDVKEYPMLDEFDIGKLNHSYKSIGVQIFWWETELG